MPEALEKHRHWSSGPPTDMTGQQRGRLTFVSWAGQGVRTRKTYWHVVCSCGVRKIVRYDSPAKSCGCLNVESYAGGAKFKNRKRDVEVVLDGKAMSLAEAARYCGLSIRTVLDRRRKWKWPEERWFEPPGRMSHKKRYRWLRGAKKRERLRAGR